MTSSPETLSGVLEERRCCRAHPVQGSQARKTGLRNFATESTVKEALCLIKHHGMVVVVGMGFTVTKHIDWSLIVNKEINIKGVFVHGLETFQDQTKHAFEWALGILAKNPTKFASSLTMDFSVSSKPDFPILNVNAFRTSTRPS